MRVSVLSFNIRYSRAPDGPHSWLFRRQRVVEVIQRSLPDIAGLQEATAEQVEYLRESLPRYEFLHRPRSDDPADDESVPLLYLHHRWRLDPDEHGTFWLSDTPEVPGSTGWGNRHPRIVTWARFVEVSSGRGLFVYNTHLSYRSDAARRRSAEFLAERVATRNRDDAAVLLGDFNTVETDWPIQYLLGKLGQSPAPLVDAYRLIHLNVRHANTFSGFGVEAPRGRIDYIFTSPSVHVLEVDIVNDFIDGEPASDHFPILASLLIRPLGQADSAPNVSAPLTC